MKKLLILMLLGVLFVPTAAMAQEITSCSSPKGKSFYHKGREWTDDKLTSGVFTFKRIGDDFDMLYVDGRKRITSSKDDGAQVFLMRRGPKDATFLVVYPQDAISLYTIWQDSDGTAWMDMLQSKGGFSFVHKSGMLIGTCGSINWSVFE